MNSSILSEYRRPIQGSWPVLILAPVIRLLKGQRYYFCIATMLKYLHKERKFSPETLARQSPKLPGYDETATTAFILVACRVGNGGHHSVAQRLAETIRRPVVASSGMVNADANEDKTILTAISSDERCVMFHPLPCHRFL
ncbi:hypothetical protein [Pseudomonas sp. NPDC086251]|uniref:hypothetical protein n=1 Tax=Pseudomonas sp. NPDC086251 TaxID=3364431 RepID=UPI0038356CA5